MSTGAGKESHKWTPVQTRALIKFRVDHEIQFTKKKYAAKQLWETLIQQLDLEGKVTHQQVAKKWENLKKKYKDLKTPRTGSGTGDGEVSAATWQFYGDMHEVLGARPCIEPPVAITSFEGPVSTSTITVQTSTPIPTSPGPSTASSSSSTASPVPSTSSESPSISDPTTPTPKRRKKNPILDLLKEEMANAQKRHEETEARTERFLQLFERLIDKLPDKQ